MVGWFLPLGLLVTVALISLSSLPAYAAVLVWGWVVFPYGAAWLRSRARTRGGGREAGGLPDLDMQYWRTRLQ